MKHLKLCFLLLFLVLVINNCSKDEELPQDDIIETGFLSLNISIEIEELPAARLAMVNTDDFIVTIHNASDGSEVMRFEPFSSAPAEIELETGEYFVRATNLEPPANAAFEQPWYFGESEVFNIDKEELKSVDLTCALANYKVSFVYSQNVLDNFTDWSATAALNTIDYLIWPKGETRDGYFVGGPLDVEVYLEYTKVFTGELITRTFNTTIDDPQPATLYRINIDASLEDGKIVININVDDSFDVIDIDLGDITDPPAPATWSKNYGGSSTDLLYGGLVSTTDGGYIAAVNTSSSDGDIPESKGGQDIWVLKLDGAGNIQWSVVLGGSGIEEAGQVVESSNGYLVAGGTNSVDGDISQDLGNFDAWLVKLDFSGNILWEKSYGGQYFDMARSATPSDNGSYIITGFTNQVTDLWLFKIDANGNELWSSTFGGTNVTAWGNDVIETTGGIVTCGWKENGGSRDYYIVKTDASGNLIWEVVYGGSSLDESYALTEIDNGYAITGFTSSNDGDVTGYHGGNDLWIIRIGTDGSLVWQKSLGGSDQEIGYDLVFSNGQEIVVAGDARSTDGDVSGILNSNTEFWLMKLDLSGNIIWNQTYGGGGSEFGRTLTSNGDSGGYTVGGVSTSNNGDVPGNNGISDVWIIKVDNNGNL